MILLLLRTSIPLPFTLRLVTEVAAYSWRVAPTSQLKLFFKEIRMNQVQNQLTAKNPSDSKTSAYCKRNNINERQFKTAMAWYHSAMQSTNQEKRTH